ncbi:tRNA (adenosine(37)-N6)-threonylcarbamoyltransferase complex ATPase subunit type 1 TsaE [Candidatus Anaplasma sp. TIGMIC]|uniref:tRNA (adenosine(37)-N6)-threonylcarbamoyltransferase complex ATPase subunit type 1 TsaE n=1 Tax=Candidatus Anaplasma sp. TIGMIC TaxID=3020713 RepID=UPI00232D4C7A|nr:tRNA (adenosine(37)-N6)-threonylcarbamoyltransferase complex ATPase subunit type 1 TsaE [Candidatus Anaplasma sp. TIGMIC]MDB1135653.1 tRNA (adenosine(37)-N6)-threonylcarbamoyltransferase complex ATPase subunit type 1 TsaE [Candidatus Anaplasma sp. TIGMIC]
MIESYKALGVGSLKEVARRCAVRLCAGCTVALTGDLGSGKTTFCREVIRKLSKDSFLGSPTYGLIHEYSCSGFTLYHVDLYRVESLREVQDLGLFEVLEENLVLIEWPKLIEEVINFDVRVSLKASGRDAATKRDVIIEWKNGLCNVRIEAHSG